MKVKLKRNVALSIMLSILILPLSAAIVQSTTYASLAVSSQVVPSTIGPGDSGNLILTISNGGTSYARSVKLTVKSHPHITFGGSSYNLGTIAPSGSVQITIPITISSSIEDYSTSASFSLSYKEGDSVSTVTIDTSASISISKRSIVQIESVALDKDIIEPGDIIGLDVYIRNVGQGDLKDMTVEFGNSTLPFISASGDIETYLGDLAKSDLKTAAFSIIINKEAKTVAYRVPITIKYYDESGVSHTDIKYIGLKISGEPDFVVTLEDDSKMYAGRTGELTISIANRGTATANFLTLSFDSNLDITPAEYYVGNLDPDDYETVTLSVVTVGILTGRRSLVIEMAYKDPYNQDMSNSATIDFTVCGAPSEKMPLATKAVLAVALVVIAYWKREYLIKLFKRKK